MIVSLDETGGVYFCSYLEDPKYVKIGCAVNFLERAKSFATHSPYTLQWDLVFPVFEEEQRLLIAAERWFHSEFNHLRYRGEWFHRQGSLDAFIDKRQKAKPHSSIAYGSSSLQISGHSHPTEFSPLPSISCLSASERNVAACLTDGITSNEIAQILSISAETVKTHISSALNKLNLSSRTQLAVWAVKAGLECPSH